MYKPGRKPLDVVGMPEEQECLFLLLYFYDLPGSVDSVLAFLLNFGCVGTDPVKCETANLTCFFKQVKRLEVGKLNFYVKEGKKILNHQINQSIWNHNQFSDCFSFKQILDFF